MVERALDRIDEALRASADLGVPVFAWRLTDAPHSASGWTLMGINPAYERSVGVSADAFAGRRLDQILPPRAAAAVLDHYVQALAGDGPYAYEEELDVSTGALWWKTTLSPVRAPGGSPLGLLGVAIDITDRKQRDFENANEIARLRRMNEEVRVFAAMAAHDVRSPLGTLHEMLGVVKSGFEDLGDGKAELLRHCRTLTIAAQRQMDRLLEHAVALEQVEGEVEPIELGALCAEIAALHDPDGRLEMDWPDEPIECDATALQLILRNLVSNAARHAKGRIVIAFAPAGNGRLRFSVSDDGPGFPEGFDPFTGVSPETRARTAHGFGLGAVRYLCEARGGTLTFERSLLGGASAQFELPGHARGRAAQAPRPDRVAAHAA